MERTESSLENAPGCKVVDEQKDGGYITPLEAEDNYTTYIFSIIRVDSHSLATELKLKIDENEANFHDLARKYSLGQESASGGILGPIMGTAISPTILAHLKNLKPNQVDTIFMFEKKWREK